MAKSLFTRTQALLRKREFQKSLKFVAPMKRMQPYRDMVDFLFCELVLGWRKECLRFYEGEGPPLRKHPRATAKQIDKWDIFLATSLRVAHAAMDQDRRLSWVQFRRATAEEVRRAA